MPYEHNGSVGAVSLIGTLAGLPYTVPPEETKMTLEMLAPTADLRKLTVPTRFDCTSMQHIIARRQYPDRVGELPGRPGREQQAVLPMLDHVRESTEVRSE